ncbi:MAG: hypothetical protein A3G18_11930 [Rhodospirillales bacterium RIFCSPLOWO2_12_FULL_58_28]|nr:MAG: hypothetical protein A3H92_12120 [Rhodospirillales bacterium RIFCSPLOWO2_02_FULL_58_16]OHC77519.1 MAG: hypothetical protein A3G18_11930 [Rhodospirillales bacterium RIFCSPLOWO2_12_FULL_58_28]
MTLPLSTRQLLQWYIESGVDETIGDAPTDRFAVVIPAVAATPPIPVRAAMANTESAVHYACELAAKAQTVDELRHALERFDGCALSKTATNLVFADGSADAKIIFIGDAPGAEEDRRGLPFVGSGGKLLDRMLDSIGLDRTRAMIANAIFWRPPGDRNPTPAETAVCMPFVERLVELVDPYILVTLGGAAAKSMLAQTSGISRIRGRWLTYTTPRLARPVHAIAVFHPDNLQNTPAQKREAWRDMLAIKRKLGEL